jgi:hypothetical protein
MAKAKIFEGRVRITSDVIDNDNVRKLEALKEDALVLTNEKTGEEIFRVAITDNANATAFSRNGVVFCNGKAVGDFTMSEDGSMDTEDMYNLEAILRRVNKVESQVKEALEDLGEEEIVIEIDEDDTAYAEEE